MRCAFCSSGETKVVDKRESEGLNRRRRECASCGKNESCETICPYSQDVHGRINYCKCCNECASICTDDI